MTEIRIDYTPRHHFLPFHACDKRHRGIVAHRRAGKTVAVSNELVRAALLNQREQPPPRYAYIGPSYAQAKDTVWAYIKHYSGPLPGVHINESELRATMPNGAQVCLYPGGDAYERMRGQYFDGAVMDEFALLNPSMFPQVVRPCLADYTGWSVVCGTVAGQDHFHDRVKQLEGMDNAAVFTIPVTATEVIPEAELTEIRHDLTDAEYAREFLCDFSAPVEGSYYTHLMNEAEKEGRITSVPHHPDKGVWCWWDIGIRDSTSVWFVQVNGQTYHVIDYLEVDGHGLPVILSMVDGTMGGNHEHRRKYAIHGHLFPHDMNNRELGSGNSRIEIARKLTPTGVTCHVTPRREVADGIEAVRSVLPVCWFDQSLTGHGMLCLRNYRRKDTGKPEHDWASHGADAFRTGAMALKVMDGWGMASPDGLRKRTRIRRNSRRVF